ncbi:Fels-1 prophage-like protein [Escherichia coli TA280]|nr:Fels-1 prophage-like protein [Escherichia coli TA280]
MTHNSINTYRRRIAVAALHRIKRKTGGNLLIVDLPDENITTIEITEQFINQLLLRFEGITRGELGRTEGETAILTAYRNAIGINQHTEYLTETGKLIIDDLLQEVIDYAKEKYINGGIN